MKVDAHQHFWNFDWFTYAWPTEQEKAIYRTIEADELEPLLKQTGIEKTVIVQADNSYADTVYMLDTASRYEWVAGVVGWVPLDRPEEARRKLEEFSANPYFKGVRHLIHMEADPDWIIQSNVIEGLKVLAEFELTFDLVSVLPEHLVHAPRLAEEIPELKIVIDHLSKPPIKEREMEPWATLIKKAAAYPNIYAKVSGLNTAADPKSWTWEDIKPYIDLSFEIFGSERLMFGSDWPVANLAGDYRKVYEETVKAVEGRPQEEVDNLFGQTANAFYRLNL
ncbi:amidohydrolase family protein [Alkalihalobacillus oceani]|uniref:Amidohydrolase family protein n=1 Tax=Halalkalibacter oceani TaxID=1653776 RepID=A0A9X2DS75_9BACI|nr:amidohydrolase family protein [Halalkalibacter oceani]MCM3715518.1 amidohydrolase family protein [Halalkalibacter oceani]